MRIQFNASLGARPKQSRIIAIKRCIDHLNERYSECLMSPMEYLEELSYASAQRKSYHVSFYLFTGILSLLECVHYHQKIENISTIFHLPNCFSTFPPLNYFCIRRFPIRHFSVRHFYGQPKHHLCLIYTS